MRAPRRLAISVDTAVDGRRAERGVALLFVLAAIVIVSTASVALVRTVLDGRTKARFDQDAAIAGEMLRAMDAPILHWLVSTSRSVVLLTTSEVPAVLVLDDRFEIDGRPIEITVTAFDAFGMLPFFTLKEGGPLQDLLPSAILNDREFLLGHATTPLGLDLLVDASGSRRSPFPFPLALQDAGSVAAEDKSTAADGNSAGAPPPEPRVGAYLSVSLENPWPGELNVHTAPVAYLEAVFRLDRRGGFSKWVAPRDRGERLQVTGSIGATGATGSTSKADRKWPRLVGESTAWYFRIDIRCGRVSRAWWALYEAGSAVEWTCAQRMAIP